MAASPGEIIHVPVNIEDENGIVESNADRKIDVTVDGGELLAFGSANPCTKEQYHTGSFSSYYGRAMAVVRAGASGIMKINAKAGEETVEAVITIKE